MRYLVELSGEAVTLAEAESIAFARPISGNHPECDGRALVIESDIPAEEIISRLALAWSVSEHKFSCEPDELDRMLGGLSLPGNSFRVRACRLSDGHNPEDGIAMARHAGELLSGRYSVNLDNPDTELRILMSRRFHAGTLLGEIDRPALEARKSENRPFSHPISLHPKLARALVNVTGIRPGETLLDPFCGTGGILLEAGLMGMEVIGGDMDERMVRGSRANLEHYGVGKHEVVLTDVSEWPGIRTSVDAIATDPPYGRSASTAGEPIETLYRRAFRSCHEVLRDGGLLSIVLPGESYAGLAEGFAPEGMYPVRVHKSLTRHFCVFRKVS